MIGAIKSAASAGLGRSSPPWNVTRWKARPGVLKAVAESDDASDAWIRRRARD
jgi:hypothetical protein